MDADFFWERNRDEREAHDGQLEQEVSVSLAGLHGTAKREWLKGILMTNLLIQSVFVCQP